MALQLTDAQPALVDADGGVRVALTGSFVMGRAYRVFVGADASGDPCYSGVSGQAFICIASSSQDLAACLPEVAPGAVDLCIVDTTNQETTAAPALLRAEAPFLNAMTYALRSDIRDILATGETSPAQLPDAKPVPGFAS